MSFLFCKYTRNIYALAHKEARNASIDTKRAISIIQFILQFGTVLEGFCGGKC